MTGEKAYYVLCFFACTHFATANWNPGSCTGAAAGASVDGCLENGKHDNDCCAHGGTCKSGYVHRGNHGKCHWLGAKTTCCVKQVSAAAASVNMAACPATHPYRSAVASDCTYGACPGAWKGPCCDKNADRLCDDYCGHNCNDGKWFQPAHAGGGGAQCSEDQGLCTSPDGQGGTDCWAGTPEEGCTCSTGEAKVTGKTIHSEGKTFYEYRCCTSGGHGVHCGDHQDWGWVVVVIIVSVVVAIIGCIVGGICCCWCAQCLCFAKSPQLVPQQAPVYQQPGGVVGQATVGQPTVVAVQQQPVAAVVIASPSNEMK